METENQTTQQNKPIIKPENSSKEVSKKHKKAIKLLGLIQSQKKIFEN